MIIGNIKLQLFPSDAFKSDINSLYAIFLQRNNFDPIRRIQLALLSFFTAVHGTPVQNEGQKFYYFFFLAVLVFFISKKSVFMSVGAGISGVGRRVLDLKIKIGIIYF